MNFKAKHHWWIWALFILWHVLAVRFWQIGFHPLLIILIIADFFLIFPEASHFNYEIKNRQFTVRRLLYSYISFPCSSIVAVENATLFTAWGGRNNVINMNQIIEWSIGTYKITYCANAGDHHRKTVLVCPKNRKKFLDELRLYADPNVILINNKESAFKKKKDEF